MKKRFLAAVLAFVVAMSNLAYVPVFASENGGNGEGENSGGDTIYNDYSTTNNTWIYYQNSIDFSPRVGSIYSINTSPALMYLGSSSKYLEGNLPIGGNGTAWKPQKEDLPNIFGSLGRSFHYAALYDGYWNTSTYSVPGSSREVPGQMSTALSNGPDAATTTFERSWADRHPGFVIDSNGDRVDFYSQEPGNGSSVTVDNPREVAPGIFPELSGNSLSAARDKESVMPIGTTSAASRYSDNIRAQTTPYSFYEWYKDTDVVKQHQDVFNSDLLTASGAELSDEVKRALFILGEDILLRDEWVASDAYPYDVIVYDYNNPSRTWHERYDMYYYIYSNTSVLDKGVATPLLTQDYVIQSIYRSLGINCLRSDVFLYADKYSTVNNTPLATMLTVDMDKINQIQNRMDVFVTRANLSKYWEKALSDGLVTACGTKATYYPASSYLPQDVNLESYDVERTYQLKLKDFLYLLKRAMVIYGEPAMTKKEQNLLLAAYGAQLPYYMDNEHLDAISYLIAKGIVAPDMYWEKDLTVEDLLVILSRVKDTGSRLTFKDIDLTYDVDLVDKGYYPVDLELVVDRPKPVEIVASFKADDNVYSGARYFDFYLKLDATWQWQWTSESGGLVDTLVMPEFYKTQVTNCWCETVHNAGEQNFHTYGYMPSEANGGIIDCGKEGTGENQYYHIKIKADYLKDYESSPYVYQRDDGDYYIGINTWGDNDTPIRVDVPFYGGVFGSYEKINYGTNYVYRYKGPNGGFSTVGRNILENKGSRANLEEYGLHVTDKKMLEALGYDPNGRLKFNEQGIIIDAEREEFRSSATTVPSGNYQTLNGAKYAANLIDYERYINSAQNDFKTRSYLSSTPTTSSGDTSNDSILGQGAVPSYDFVIQLSDKNGDMYWKGDTLPSIRIHDPDDDRKLLDIPLFSGQLQHNVTFLGHYEGYYYIQIHGKSSAEEISENLLQKDLSQTDLTPVRGYVKQNNTFLIPLSLVRQLMHSKTIVGMLGYDKINCSVARRVDQNNDSSAPAMYVISCDRPDVLQAYQNEDYTPPFTILIDLQFHRICVNNVIYDVPEDEELVVPIESDGKDDYYINYRAFTAWFGNITTSHGDDGHLTLTYDKQTLVTTSEVSEGDKLTIGSSSNQTESITDVWTRMSTHSQIITVTTAKGEITGSDLTNKTPDELLQQVATMNPTTFKLLPMHSPYAQANYFIYTGTGGADAYIITVKPRHPDYVPSTDSSTLGPAMWLESMFNVRVDEKVVVASGRILEPNVDIYRGTLSWFAGEVATRGFNSFSGKIFYNTEDGGYYYIIPKVDVGDELTTTMELDVDDVNTTFPKLTTLVTTYMTDTSGLLPVYEFEGKGVYSILANVFGDLPYGAMPNYVVSDRGSTLLPDIYNSSRQGVVAKLEESLDWDTGDDWDNYSYYDWMYYAGQNVLTKSSEACTLSANQVTLAPTGLPYTAMQMPYVKGRDLLSMAGDSTYILWGSALGATRKSTEGAVTIFARPKGDIGLPTDKLTDLNSMMQISVSNSAEMQLVCGSLAQQFIAIGKPALTHPLTTDEALDDRLRRGDLADTNQPGSVDWGAYTFNTLIHDVDNGASILLIIVLNIIPRIALLFFLVLLTLSTIANVKPWKQFCNAVFDPYKLLTFGHTSVDTVHTGKLMLTSIIGLAVFALFMDGTIINLLTWISQFGMKFIKG